VVVAVVVVVVVVTVDVLVEVVVGVATVDLVKRIVEVEIKLEEADDEGFGAVEVFKLDDKAGLPILIVELNWAKNLSKIRHSKFKFLNISKQGSKF
jgi:MFS superfamily sulfate permease-like transporter